MSDTLGIVQKEIISPLGQALAGIEVYVLSGDLSTVNLTALTPLATVHADPGGVTQVSNPVTTDGLGNLTSSATANNPGICLATGYYVLVIPVQPGVLAQINFQIAVSAAAQAVSFETNGTPNSDQAVLNLEAGSGITLTAGSGGAVTIGAEGAGVPVVAISGSYSIGTQNVDQAGANAIALYYLDIPDEVTFDKLVILGGGNGTSGTQCDFGIYNTSGQLLANIGPVAGNSSVGDGSAVFSVNQGSVTLSPGSYIFAVTANANSGGFSFYVSEPYVVHDMYTTTTPSSAGTLPSTIAVTVISNATPFSTQPIFPVLTFRT